MSPPSLTPLASCSAALMLIRAPSGTPQLSTSALTSSVVVASHDTVAVTEYVIRSPSGVDADQEGDAGLRVVMGSVPALSIDAVNVSGTRPTAPDIDGVRVVGTLSA